MPRVPRSESASWRRSGWRNRPSTRLFRQRGRCRVRDQSPAAEYAGRRIRRECYLPRGRRRRPSKATQPRPESLREYNHLAFGPLSDDTRGSDGLSLDEIEPLRLSCACTVVVVDLGDPVQTGLQLALAQRGYRLMSIQPPRHTYIGEGNAVQRVSTAAIGYWVKPSGKHPIAPPYYSHMSSRNADEQQVLDHLRESLRLWGNSL